jgi:hypothetical protein
MDRMTTTQLDVDHLATAHLGVEGIETTSLDPRIAAEMAGVDAIETEALPDLRDLRDLRDLPDQGDAPDLGASAADLPETTLLPPLAAKAQGLAARMDEPETTWLPPLTPGARQAAREAADLPETTLLPPLAAKARGLAADLDLAGTTQLPPPPIAPIAPIARPPRAADVEDAETQVLPPHPDTLGALEREPEANPAGDDEDEMVAQRALLEQTAPALRAAPRQPLGSEDGARHVDEQ